MSDKILNRLEIIGSDEQVKSVLEYIKGNPARNGSERFIDFNKIVEMPVLLGVDVTGLGNLGQLLLSGTGDLIEYLSIEKAQLEFLNLKIEDRCSALFLGMRYKDNLVEYGHRAWDTWGYENWGTKWNAWEQFLSANNVVAFTTANFDVHGLIQKLSTIFPDIEFRYSWDDISNEWNCIIQNGVIKSSDFDVDELEKSYTEPVEFGFFRAFLNSQQGKFCNYESPFIDG